MNIWADIHGEEHEWSFRSKPSRNAKWCDNCQCFVEYIDMKRQKNDDESTSFLCDGCDYEFEELRESESDRDDYHHSQHMEPTP